MTEFDVFDGTNFWIFFGVLSIMIVYFVGEDRYVVLPSGMIEPRYSNGILIILAGALAFLFGLLLYVEKKNDIESFIVSAFGLEFMSQQLTLMGALLIAVMFGVILFFIGRGSK